MRSLMSLLLLLLQDMGEEKVFDTLSAHDRHISSLSVSLDGNLLLSASHDGTAKVRTTPTTRARLFHLYCSLTIGVRVFRCGIWVVDR